MKMQINLDEPSTQRGIVVALLVVAGTAGWWMRKDPTGIILLAQAISAAMKIAIPDTAK